MDEANSRSLASRLADVLQSSYTIESEIGRGGMGVVYSARDLKLNRRVAIKLLPPDLAFRDEIRTRFLREAQTAARLSHPHIVPIHTVGDEGGLVYFVMGYVDGESVAARLRRRGRLPAEEVRRIMKETADALGLAHAMGIIHRDVKPDNILLEGTRGRVMVTDFGIAKALSDAGTLTGTGVAIGTPSYMSPEQAAGEREIDARSDLYSLGIVAYEMLIGELPFHAPTVPGILMKHIAEPTPDILQRRPDAPEDLAATIQRCLEKDPEDRWPTADALRRALETRKSVPYRRGSIAPRRRGSSPELRPARGGTEARPPASPRARTRERGRDRVPAESSEHREAEIVRRFRGHFATYVSINGCLLLMNVATGITEPWFLFPAIGWGFGLASQFAKLWQAGYSWRDVIYRPPAKDSIETQQLPAVGRPLPAALGAGPDDFGKLAPQISQMKHDREAVVRIVERLPKSERKLLPEIVPTVDALMSRAVELARTLQAMEGEVETASLERLDQRIAALKSEAASAEQDRRLDLLQRQRQTLSQLIDRRGQVEGQFESCLLAVQNVRFDLLRLRSAGVAAVLDDLTSATQQARALSVDVEAAISAAGEIREALGKTTGT
ncbi:MAG: protein kinase [Gemmatimonadetes bacterium]|nr:protein kinase [Gemmatimonadota bacterium]